MQNYTYFSFYPRRNESFRRKGKKIGKDFVFLRLDKNKGIEY